MKEIKEKIAIFTDAYAVNDEMKAYNDAVELKRHSLAVLPAFISLEKIRVDAFIEAVTKHAERAVPFDIPQRKKIEMVLENELFAYALGIIERYENHVKRYGLDESLFNEAGLSPKALQTVKDKHTRFTKNEQELHLLRLIETFEKTANEIAAIMHDKQKIPFCRAGAVSGLYTRRAGDFEIELIRKKMF